MKSALDHTARFGRNLIVLEKTVTGSVIVQYRRYHIQESQNSNVYGNITAVLTT